MNKRGNRADSIEDLQSYKAVIKDRSESTSREAAIKSDWVVTGRPRPNLLNQRFDEGLIAYPVIGFTANSRDEALNRPLFR